MMESLEGSTLDLIYRRSVKTFYPGYAMILMVCGIVAALPLVKVDVVSSSGGMIRPFEEPVDLYASLTGIVDSSLLADHLHVCEGDTLIWIRKNLARARAAELSRQVDRLRIFIRDIEGILQGDPANQSSRYIQSYRNFSTSCRRLRLQMSFLKDEFDTAAQLYDQEVIPSRDYEKARSEYLLSRARLDDHIESYHSHLEDELNQYAYEKEKLEYELDELQLGMQNYAILAPCQGMLNQCIGIGPGSVIQPGIRMGTITPAGILAADCYVNSGDIREIRTGMKVKICLDGKRQKTDQRLETFVSHIDPDVVLVNGRSVYRVRCLLDESSGYIPGMTFIASMVLYRTSIGSILTEKLSRRFNPSLASIHNTRP